LSYCYYCRCFVVSRLLHICLVLSFKYLFFCCLHACYSAFSALMLLVGRQEGNLACKKTEWWVAGVVICLDRGADLHMAQLMPLPLTVSCFSKILTGFTFLVPAHPGRTTYVQVVLDIGSLNGCVCTCVLCYHLMHLYLHRAVKQVCVYMHVMLSFDASLFPKLYYCYMLHNSYVYVSLISKCFPLE